MNRKLDKTSSSGRVTFKKQLVRNPSKTNSRALVIRDREQIEPLILNDAESSGEPASSRSQPLLKKTTFNVPDIDASLRSLSLNCNSKSKNGSKTSLSEKDSKQSNFSDKSTKLDIPGINSSLSLGKKIDSLGKVRSAPIKGPSGKRAFDEKVR